MVRATTTALPTCPVSAIVGANTPLSSKHTFSFANDSPNEIYVTFRGVLRDTDGHEYATYVHQGQLVTSGEVKEIVDIQLVSAFVYDVPRTVTLIAESEIVDYFSGAIYHYSSNSCSFTVS